MYTTIELETEKIVDIVDKIAKEGGELAMTTAMRLKEEGIKEEKIKTAKRMKNEELDINLIQKITGLTKEEIEKL